MLGTSMFGGRGRVCNGRFPVCHAGDHPTLGRGPAEVHPAGLVARLLKRILLGPVPPLAGLCAARYRRLIGLAR